MKCDTSVEVIECARAMTVWEFMSEPDPERMEYAIECYIDALIQLGIGIEEVRSRAMLDATRSINRAVCKLAGQCDGNDEGGA